METYKNYKKHFLVSLFMMLSLNGWSDSLTGYVGDYVDLPEPTPPSSALEIHWCNFYIDDDFNISNYLQVVGHQVYISRYFEGQLPVTVDVWYRRKDNGKVYSSSTFYHYVTCWPVELSGFPTVGLNMEVGERKKIDWSCSPSSRLPYVNLNWTSSNSNIVSVDNYGELTAKSAGDAVISVENNAGPGKSFNVSVRGGGNQPAPSPIMIVLPNYTETIKVGQKITLEPVISPANAETNLSWISSNTSVATVTQTGVVEGIKVGEAKITVTTDNDKSAYCYVKVESNTVEPTGITLPASKTVKVGASFTMTYTLTPSNATTTLTWSSDDTSIATVSSSGVVKGIKAGTTKIRVKTANGKTDYCNVTVESNTVEPTGIDVYPSSRTIKVGESFSATYSVEPSNATTTVTWYSDDSSIATVTSSGKVTGVKAGTTYINAKTANGKEDWCKVTVEEVNEPMAVASASTKFFKSLIVMKDGTLWACGYNYYGELGDGTTTTRTSPIKIMSGVSSVSAGGWGYSHIVKTDGSLWACGDNEYGQLGDGTTTGRHLPVKIMDGVSSVAAGDFHTLIVKKDGTLWACGYNYCGQLGDGTKTERHTPVKIMEGVTSVAAGGNGGLGHSLIVKKDGSLWVCGNNDFGQLGDGTRTNRYTPVKLMDDVSQVAAGFWYTLIVKKDGTLWGCGSNECGQLGNGTTTDQHTPIKIMDDVASIDAAFHSLIVKKDGTLWGCGGNDSGQLGDGTTTDRHTPIKIMDGVASAVGDTHTLIIKKDGTLWACGRNHDGQLGDGTTTDRHTPVQIKFTTVGISDVKKQSLNDGHIYNLNGQRVSSPKKGLYIRDGKKVLMK